MQHADIFAHAHTSLTSKNPIHNAITSHQLKKRVSLEVLEDGITPKPPSESWNDNLPKLYIHHNAFMKVLGGTLDVDFNAETGDLTPKLFDREGNVMDPNA
mmetsp:Transcript_15933/g.27163  ORF Transcript_15933/g.27163 Transcript_15933/m.27163 type:complete len:101 (+) Transcript_15933:29-331(+)